MKIEITSTFRAETAMKQRGLGPDKGLQKYVAARVRLRCDPYVPKQSGTLKNTAQIAPDGSAITYSQPYYPEKNQITVSTQTETLQEAVARTVQAINDPNSDLWGQINARS